MAAINKNFVIKNGLEVDTKTLYVDATTNRVGVGSTIPTATFDVVGDSTFQGTLNSPSFVVGVATAGTIGVSTLSATDVTVSSAATVTGPLECASFTVLNSATIGSSSADQMALNAEVTTNIIPATADVYDFGYSNKKWRDIHLARNINAGTLVGLGLSVGVGTARSLATQELSVTGFSTFTNGPVVIGSGTSTGTVTQRFQVTGGAYVSGNLGLGVTNPTSKLHVSGDTLITGVATATEFNGNINAGVGTITTLGGNAIDYANLYANTGIVTTISGTTATYTNGDFTVLDGETTYANTGIVTTLSGTKAKYTTLDGETTYANTGIVTTISGTTATYTNGDFTVLDGETTYANTGVITSLTGTKAKYTTLDGSTFFANSGIITALSGSTADYVVLDGETTYANVGVVTTLSGSTLNYSGIATVGSVSIGSTQIVSSDRQLQNIPSLDAVTTSTISAAVASAPNNFVTLSVIGISTFTNGPVLVGSGTSTGTVTQRFQVTGGAHVSGSAGIGTTNPKSKLHVIGDALISGVATATAFNGNINAGVGNVTTLSGTTATYTTGNLTNASVTNAYVTTGIVTTISGTTATYTNGDFTVLDGETTYANTGVITSLTGTKAKYTTLDGGTNFFANTGIVTTLSGTTATYVNGDFTVLDGATTYANVGVVTTISGNLATYTLGDFVVVDGTQLYSNTGIVTTLSGSNLNYSGIGTISRLNGTNLNYSGLSTVSLLTGATANFTGVGTFGSLSIGPTSVISSGRQLQNISSLDSTTTSTISAAVASAPNNFVTLAVAGISTFTNGPVLIGSGTPTGTASQPLQVTGGAYVSGSAGIGTTNPKSKLHVIGDALISGVATATAFNGNINANVGVVTTISGTTATYTTGNLTNASVTNAYVTAGIVTTISGTTATYTFINGTNANLAGIVTATKFATGADGAAINVEATRITGPSELIIDPQNIADNTGLVRIKGDLYVDGDQFVVNSGTVELADFVVGIATTVASNAVLDGAGIAIGNSSITSKTLTYSFGSTALKSSENFDLASGKNYKINGTDVLSSTTLLVPQINASGVSTVATLTGTTATYTTGNFTSISGTTATYVNGDFTVLDGETTYANVGVVTTISGTTATYVNGDFTVLDGATTYANVGVVTTISGNLATYTNGDFTVLDGQTTYANVGIVTTISGTTATYTNGDFTVLDGQTTYANTGIITSLTGTKAKYTTLDGETTYANTGIVTTLSGTTATYTNGDFTVLDGETTYANVGVVTTISGTTATYTTGNFTSISGTTATYVNGDFAVLDGATTYINSGIITTITNATTFTAIPAFNGGTSGSTAPFTVDSTTKVTNLNADYLDGIDITGFLRSDAADSKTAGNLTFNDTIYALFGTGSDLLVGHNGTHSIIDVQSGATGDLYIRNQRTSGSIFLQADDSGGTLRTVFAATGASSAAELYYQGSKKLETTSTGVSVTGTLTVSSNTLVTNLNADLLDGISSASFLRSDVADSKTAGTLTFNDSISALFGTGSDLAIYHDGSNSIITQQAGSTGDLYIRNQRTSGSIYLQADDSGGTLRTVFAATGASSAAELYHQGSKKFETTSTGVSVTGEVGSTALIYTTGTGIEAGQGSGSVALTTNDGYGNANLCFNHRNGTPDATGSSGRITCAVDSSTASMSFQLGSSTTSGVAGALTTLLQLTETGLNFQGTCDAHFDDNVSAYFGTGNDLQIYHTGTESSISDSSVNGLSITSSTALSSITISVTDLGNINLVPDIFTQDAALYLDSVNNTATLFNSGLTLNGGDLLPATTNTGAVGTSTKVWSSAYFTNAQVNGTLSVRAALDLADNDILRFGTGDDWEFFHNGTNNFIDLNTGDLIIRQNTTTRFTFERTTGKLIANTFESSYGGACLDLTTTVNGRTATLANTDASFANTVCFHDVTRSANAAFSFEKLRSGGTTDLEFNLRGDGNAYADGSWNGGGADYAEYFEWLDGNPNEEDRRGYSVVLEGDKIRVANEGEEPIGVISGNPSVVGDAAWNKWSHKYLTDDFGTYITETHKVIEWEESVEDSPMVDAVYDENGDEVSPEIPASYKTETRSYEDWNLPEGLVIPENAVYKTHDENGNLFTHRALNPSYDPDLVYVPREERPEWDAVGIMGKLRLRKGQAVGSRWIKMKDISDAVEEWLVR